MKITPSPRILKMLGQIEFAEWQCLAELIDNSIDALRQAEACYTATLSDDDYCIEVYLPDGRIDRNSKVEIKDHAPGMTPSRLQKAVKAGWSGNDQFDQLGLFGMGFNVATARLGRTTTVLTTQTGDPSWIGVEIDLDNLGDDFEARDLELAKDVDDVHGTHVSISNLDPERAALLVRRQSAIRAKLGHIYSWILSNSRITIRVNGRLVTPREPCVWAEHRSVVRGSGKNSETVPAVISIDEELGTADACSDCGSWQGPGEEKCCVCGSSNLNSRRRRIWGWVGVQRYLHSRNYGIDFLRNGRKIITFDKDVFSWLDPNNPSALPEPEYPVEVPADQGRLIGEIHLDHVPVHYMKDRFDTADRAWRSAIEFLRGAGPLKPQRAKQLGYPSNESPIGRLFRGYRRNDPGYAYLIPGDGSRAINQQAHDWAQKFYRGDSEFQDDTRWWQAVVYHEEQRALKNEPAESSSDNPDLDAVINALGGSAGNSSAGNEKIDAESDASNVERPLTIQDRVQSLLENAKPNPILSRDVHLRSLGDTLRVKAFDVFKSPLIDANNESHTPIWLSPSGGGSVNLFIDINHESFTVHGIDLVDLAIAQIAHFMLTRSQSTEHSLAQIVSEVRRENFDDLSMDFPTVQGSARELLNQIKASLLPVVSENPGRAWQLLSSDEIAQMESNAALTGRRETVLDSSDSAFIEAVPFLFLLKLFNAWPEAFLDGKVFASNFSNVSDDTARSITKSRVSSLLIDVIGVAAEERSPASLNHLRRARIAIDIIGSEMDGI